MKERPKDRPIKYNDASKAFLKQLKTIFSAAGFSKLEASALAKTYFDCLADRTYRGK